MYCWAMRSADQPAPAGGGGVGMPLASAGEVWLGAPGRPEEATLCPLCWLVMGAGGGIPDNESIYDHMLLELVEKYW